MKIRVNTTEYEFSHGRRPRGNGCWVFSVRNEAGQEIDHQRLAGTYAASRDLVLKLARDRNRSCRLERAFPESYVAEIVVGP